MKKKIFSILFALVLVLSFSLVTAVPVGAQVPLDYEASVLATADRLAVLQNEDGGFMWRLVEPAGPSGLNTLGITAMGILEAYELEDKATYETALAEAYGFAHATSDCRRFPDVTFLVGLAEEASDDASLLAAIETEVSGTTVQSILDLAKARWDTRLAELGGGDPVVMAEFMMEDGVRPGKLEFWDLEAAVKAALALEPHFTGYKAQAIAIAGVMHDNLQVGSTYHFDITNASTVCYTLALGGAIEAFSELGVYPTTARTVTDRLIAYQNEVGYWDESDVGDTVSVQVTAYAVMALIAQGDGDALVAAKKGGDWLVSTQDETGGWYPCYSEATWENLEVDSEAAWAIKVLSDVSGSVSMIAAYIPSIGISVAPLAVDFGSVTPGTASATKTVTVMNTGNVVEDFSTTIENESVAGVYTTGLAITWTPGASDVAIGGTADASLILTVPTATDPGTYTAVLVFWAEMAD